MLERQALAALAAFTLQNGCAALLMRFTKTRTEAYSTEVAVLLQEVAVKLPISLLLYAIECRGVLAMCAKLVDDVRSNPKEWLQLSIPALFYTVQNNMLYLGFANLNSAIGLITYQTKIPLTALCSVWLLGKRLSLNQWISLGVLVVGVILSHEASGDAPPPTNHTRARRLDAVEPRAQSPLVGVLAFLVAAATSAFASVYFERMIRSEGKPSLWLRNIQLALNSSLIASAGIVLQNDPSLREEGFLHGFGLWTWITVLWQSAGGIVVAVTIKYAGNILRCFAQGMAIAVAALGSWIFFSFHVTANFVCGVGLVMLAIFIYSDDSATPAQLAHKLLGALGVRKAPLAVSQLSAADDDDAFNCEEEHSHRAAASVEPCGQEEAEGKLKGTKAKGAKAKGAKARGAKAKGGAKAEGVYSSLT